MSYKEEGMEALGYLTPNLYWRQIHHEVNEVYTSESHTCMDPFHGDARVMCFHGHMLLENLPV